MIKDVLFNSVTSLFGYYRESSFELSIDSLDFADRIILYTPTVCKYWSFGVLLFIYF